MADFEAYKVYKNSYNKIIRRAKINHIEHQINGNKGNSKVIWRELNSFTNRKSAPDELPGEFIHNDEVIKTRSEIAAGFNNFFTTIAQHLNDKLPSSNIKMEKYLPQNKYRGLKLQEIEATDLFKIIEGMRPKVSCGEDKCSNKILKHIIQVIWEPLLELINHSLSTGIVPPEWKVAKIVPVYKSKNKSLYTNYRPISLLSTFSKVIEKIVQAQVENYLLEENIITDLQFGFRASHETTHAVISLMDKISRAGKKANLCVFFDLMKCFDTLSFELMIKKLEHYGIDPEWFTSYIHGRKQYTQIDETKSVKQNITSGVPQGSVLGPLLFKIYINDMPLSTKMATILFADDTTYHLSADNEIDLVNQTNLELSKVADWFLANRLTTHPSKTMYMVFSGDKSKIENKILLQGNQIKRIGESREDKSTKFVGLHIDENLRWSHHVDHVCKKVNSGSFLINKFKHFLPMKHRVLLYNAIVKPHLEYGLLAWGNLPKHLENKIWSSIIRTNSMLYISVIA